MPFLLGQSQGGIRLPVITQGADIVNIIADSIMSASKSDNDRFDFRDRDIVGVTESLLARSQGNYVTIDDISEDIRRKVPEGRCRADIPNNEP